MQIRTLSREAHEKAYGILCRKLHPSGGEAPAFGATHCVIERGGSTSPHAHFERETFVILEGHGRMTIAGESREVEAGDSVLIPPHSVHQLVNLSQDADLVFLSIYWDDAAAGYRRSPATLISAAPPTPNGKLHVGHLSGPYVAADVHARYLRLRGLDSAYLCGSDDNQSYVATKAARSGMTPDEVTETFGDANEATLAAIGCQVDLFLRPRRDASYASYVQAFFKQMVEKGQVVALDAPHLHCEGCKTYLFEAHVSGRCPRCGVGTSGNGCEQCAYVNDCVDLIEPKCTGCGQTPEVRTGKRFYFELDRHRTALERYLEDVAMSPRLRALTRAFLDRDLPRISVTHVAGWGIPVPIEGFEGQVLYEWLEMAAGYRYASEALKDRLGGRDALKDHASSFIQCFGFDNSFFYTLFIPAVLRAHDPDTTLPRAFLGNEFYRLDGLKFSTSRNHAVWGDEILEKGSADALRFHVALDRPEHDQTSFSLDGFERTVRDELAGTWRAWIREISSRLGEQPGGAMPECRDMTHEEERFLDGLTQRVQRIGRHHEAESFSMRQIARELSALVHEARDFGKATDFLRGSANLERRRATRLALEVTALEALAIAAAPLMPRFAAGLRRSLGLEAEPRWPGRLAPRPAGTRLGAPPDFDLDVTLGVITELRDHRKEAW